MNKEQFKNILEQYQILLEYEDHYLKFGVDLTDGQYPIVEPIDKIIDIFWSTIYTSVGIDWIYWFIFENDFGKNNLEATYNKKLICQDIDGLYDHIDQYRLWQ